MTFTSCLLLVACLPYALLNFIGFLMATCVLPSLARCIQSNATATMTKPKIGGKKRCAYEAAWQPKMPI